MRARYYDVPRELFNKVCDMIMEEPDLKVNVEINYDGTHLCGTVWIQGYDGHSEDFKKVLQFFNEEYCK